ncbi:TetR/AcrR family transcriptional regulator [Mycolicibacterium arenosum]|uniref:TetR/AcrR family transcriptional regulator n=1 Tax=Mycolicibacterium arenosum TaxID=2952157 RepID=A0ABT1LWJ7_9MYCO|nr:TetR/AcrR family transcriptional regulator [Mycolicibacterium sp. CAU 1645]MCP9271284.1 TetR/AcrR family transcriptional regulator [Mycolicibacterium sp. CAU 1645]
MTETARPMRADAARNRARVLEVAYDTFAAEGVAVPIDEIARRAGVGPGTIYRHFPTKEALFEAVISDRVRVIVEQGRTLLADDPGTALFEFLRGMVRTAAFDHGLADALERYGVDFDTAAPGAEATFLGLTDELLTAAQRAGTVRTDVGAAELKALFMVCKSSGDMGEGVAERVADVVVDGLRSR